MGHPFQDPAVKAAYDGFPDPPRTRLLQLRTLIFETAAETPGVGPLAETLKWGEPAYVPDRPKIGTPIRLGVSKKTPGHSALFVHCQTDLVERFRGHYEGQMSFEGNRAVLVNPDLPVPVEAIKHCISLALTYHLKRA